MNKRNTELITGFRQIVPYINFHRGKIFVIMLSSEVIKNENFSEIVSDIGLLHSLGISLVLVYGVSLQIDNFLSKLKIKKNYHKNIRITDFKSLSCVKRESGRLQLEITALLSMSLSDTPLEGANINVVSGNFIIAQPLGIEDGVDYLHSGRIRKINKESILKQLEIGSIVLIGPVAVSVTGESFNLISEEIATELSIQLKAEKLIGFCEKQGVMNKDEKVISELFPNEVEKIIKNKNKNKNIVFSSSVIRFLKGSIEACKNKVPRSHLISYLKHGSLLQELFSRNGIGSQIVAESTENIRKAVISDIGGILDLIKPLEKKRILVRRSREQLEFEIDKFTVIKQDNLTIGCAALYPFIKENIGEMACLVVHPDYRSSFRGETLLKSIISEARNINLKKIFVLTVQSVHWFQERGFFLVNIDSLPESKKKMYNYQRNSKVLMYKL
ncbi:Amino-acid acetyltransferase [Buchnera aphidicola (Tetraneura ulmi)]|uniref:amino-acid N-acetyltransferase n=1 Tax=Buchnera aphidicola TaxID=9 RepID=UPI003464C684